MPQSDELKSMIPPASVSATHCLYNGCVACSYTCLTLCGRTASVKRVPTFSQPPTLATLHEPSCHRAGLHAGAVRSDHRRITSAPNMREFHDQIMKTM